MKKHKSPLELIARNCEKSTTSWYNILCPSDKEYVKEVVAILLTRQDVSFYSIAEALIEELSIDRTPGTVVKKLKEIARNATKKSK